MPISEALLKKLADNDAELTKLIFGPERLTEDDVDQLVDAAKNNTHLRMLTLTDNSITDRGAARLSELKNLWILVLDANEIGDEGVKKLVTMSELKELSLGGNKVTDEGAKLLAASRLFLLNLYSNHITDIGASCFLKNKTLTELSLHHNAGISSEMLERIGKHIKNNEDEAIAKDKAEQLQQRDAAASVEASEKKEEKRAGPSSTNTPILPNVNAVISELARAQVAFKEDPKQNPTDTHSLFWPKVERKETLIDENEVNQILEEIKKLVDSFKRAIENLPPAKKNSGPKAIS